MDEKPKILTILARFWLLLGVIFILEAFFLILWLIVFLTTAEVNTPNWYPFCTTVLIPVIITLFIFAMLSLKKHRSIHMGDKSEIKRSFIFSFIFLIIFGSLTSFVILMVQFSWSLYNWPILGLLVFWILTLIIDIAIILLSTRSQVKEYLKVPFEAK